MGKGMQILVGWKWVFYGFVAGFFTGLLAPWLWNFFAGL